MEDTLNRILSTLKERHISKGKFLADLNLDKSAISEWVHGTHKSYMKYLPQIAEYFDVSLDWLAGNEQKTSRMNAGKIQCACGFCYVLFVFN